MTSIFVYFFLGKGENSKQINKMFYLHYHIREVKKNQKHFDGFNPQWGGGGFSPNPLFTYFFYF